MKNACSGHQPHRKIFENSIKFQVEFLLHFLIFLSFFVSQDESSEDDKVSRRIFFEQLIIRVVAICSNE